MELSQEKRYIIKPKQKIISLLVLPAREVEISALFTADLSELPKQH